MSGDFGQRDVMFFYEVNVESKVGEITASLTQRHLKSEPMGMTGLWCLPLLSYFL